MAYSEDLVVEDIQDLESVLETLHPVEDEEVFGEGDDSFTVKFRCCSRKEVDALSVAIQSKRGQRAGKEELRKFRTALRDKCLVGWTDLTLLKVAHACNMTLNGNGPKGEAAVTFTKQNAMAMLERARGSVPESDTTVSFDDWVYEKATAIAQKKHARETAEKNA